MKQLNKAILITLLFLRAAAGHAVPDISMEVYRYQSASSPFIEVSLYVAGSSMLCHDESGLYGIRYVLMIRDTLGNVVGGNRYSLNASGCPAKDIMDVKRYSLSSGTYIIDLEAADLGDSLETVTTSQRITISGDQKDNYISDLELLSTIKPEKQEATSLNKSGMYLEPLPFRLYYPALNQLNLYHETYHIDELPGQAYIQYVITPIAGDSTQILRSFKKLKKEPINANIFQLDISSLISGHYILEANVYDGDKKLKATAKTNFSRLNPTGDSIYLETAALNADVSFVSMIPADSLEYYMRAMAPIISSIDNDVMNMLLKKGSEKAKRYFIHRYWTTQAGKHGDLAFSSYMKVAKIVDDQFRSGFGYGFETDRGHVFLKYGTPDDRISEESEPSAPPYEIWFYNEFPATHQTNVRFLFYNPSLSHNAYKLLHSTAIGEVYNSRWELELYRDATLETPGVNVKAMGENVNRNARRYFEN